MSAQKEPGVVYPSSANNFTAEEQHANLIQSLHAKTPNLTTPGPSHTDQFNIPFLHPTNPASSILYEAEIY